MAGEEPAKNGDATSTSTPYCNTTRPLAYLGYHCSGTGFKAMLLNPRFYLFLGIAAIAPILGAGVIIDDGEVEYVRFVWPFQGHGLVLRALAVPRAAIQTQPLEPRAHVSGWAWPARAVFPTRSVVMCFFDLGCLSMRAESRASLCPDAMQRAWCSTDRLVAASVAGRTMLRRACLAARVFACLAAHARLLLSA